MAVTLLGTNGLVASGNEKVSDNSFVVTFTAATEVGDRLYLAIASDNLSSTTPTISTAVDSKGNSWSLVSAPNAAASGAAASVVLRVYKCEVTVAHAINDTVTITLSGAVTAKAALVFGVRDVTGSEIGLVTGANTSGTPGLVVGPPAVGSVVIGFQANENNVAGTGDTDTLNGSWSTLVSAASSGSTAATNVAVGAQAKIVTATGNQTWGLAGTADYAAVAFALAEDTYVRWYRTITANNAGGAVKTDHPVRVDLNSTNFSDWDKVTTTGSDLEVRSSDGTTPLQFYVEAFDKVAQTGIVWIKFPSIGAGSTAQARIYYGSAVPGAAQNPSQVFTFAETFSGPESIRGTLDDSAGFYAGNYTSHPNPLAQSVASTWNSGQLREQSPVLYNPNAPAAERHVFLATGQAIENIAVDGLESIGVWFSPDGENFTQYGNTFVIENAEDPWVVLNLDGSIYFDGDGFAYCHFERKPGGQQDNGVARTRDFKTWLVWAGNRWSTNTSEHAIVLPRGAAGTWDETFTGSPTVLFDGTRFVYLYEGAQGSVYKTGIAYSTNNINWTKGVNNPICNLEVVDEIIKIGSTWIMIGHDAGGFASYRWETAIEPTGSGWDSQTAFTQDTPLAWGEAGSSSSIVRKANPPTSLTFYNPAPATQMIHLDVLGGNTWRFDRKGGVNPIKTRVEVVNGELRMDAPQIASQIIMRSKNEAMATTNHAWRVSIRGGAGTKKRHMQVAVGNGAITPGFGPPFGTWSNSLAVQLDGDDIYKTRTYTGGGFDGDMATKSAPYGFDPSANHVMELRHYGSNSVDVSVDGVGIIMSGFNNATAGIAKGVILSTSDGNGGHGEVFWGFVFARKFDGVDPTITLSAPVGILSAAAATATLTTTAQTATIIPGTITVVAASATLNTSSQTAEATISASAINVTAVTGAMTWTSETGTVTPGSVTLAANTATVTANAQTAIRTVGGVTQVAGTASMSIIPQSASLSAGGVTLMAGTVSLTLTSSQGTTAPGATTIVANSSSMVSVSQTAAISATVTLIAAETTLTSVPQAAGISAGAVISLAATSSLTLNPFSGSTSVGPVQLTAATSTLTGDPQIPSAGVGITGVVATSSAVAMISQVSSVFAGGVTVSPAITVFTSSSQSPAVISGAVSRIATSLTLGIVAQNATALAGGYTASAGTAIISTAPQSPSVNGGSIAHSAASSTISFAAQNPGVIAGARTLNATSASFAAISQEAVVSFSLVLTATPATLSTSGQIAAVIAGGVVQTANRATMTSDAQSAVVSGVGLMLATSATGVFIPANAGTLMGPVVRVASTAILSLTFQPSEVILPRTVVATVSLLMVEAQVALAVRTPHVPADSRTIRLPAHGPSSVKLSSHGPVVKIPLGG